MPREKKDGRYINYYLARDIYEQVAQYAKENGHTMTCAVERLLKKGLEAEKASLIHEKDRKVGSNLADVNHGALEN